MKPQHRPKLPSPNLVIDAVPLTREAFASFGDVIENPRPDVHPSSAASQTSPLSLPFNAVSANQGTALKYQHVSHPLNLYAQAPSRRPGVAVTNMFVCAARADIPASSSSNNNNNNNKSSLFPVKVLERHPYTTQTFLPLPADAVTTITPTTKYYLVIVAPTLPAPSSSSSTGGGSALLSAPDTLPPGNDGNNYPRPLPGSGLPDLHGLRAFVATGAQAITYGAGTWHAPMVALGPAGTAMDFVVMQFANGVGAEDCQEVELESPEVVGMAAGEGGVRIRPSPPPLLKVRRGRVSKL
ncbi:hypothetical protein MFIFM68171_06427 [Madurella fahalii]|uniref:Ureidoglycolate hydrolase n=1 Tax=Madurella fahalii TaxID=1157608 RepID=A0ABQ0GEN0_9PEZI